MANQADPVLRELRVLAGNSHPHLVAFHDLAVHEGVPYLVLEHLAGGSLADRIDGSRLSPCEVVEIGSVVSRVLGFLHARGILHLDVKPSNIGFTAAGVPKLMDLGISQRVGEERRFPALSEPVGVVEGSDLPATLPCDIRTTKRRPTPRTRILYGTLQYLAPEAFDGEPPSVDWDLWGLAATLWEAVTGVRAFGGSQREIVERVTLRGAPDPRTTRSGCPAPLARLLVEALRPERELRPRTAQDLAQRLEAVALALTELSPGSAPGSDASGGAG